MNSKHLPRTKSNRYDVIPKALFLITVLVSILTTWHVTNYFLDGDAASEMVLAKHWLDTGSILSKDWIYGSEIRLLHMQLLYAPLMLLFEDWHLVRFLGAVIAQLLYMASYAFLIRQTGLDKRYFYIGGTVLLLPVSVAYGRVILYHNHYMPNIIISFCLIGLFLGFTQQHSWKKTTTWLRLLVMLALSFLSGINSLRQLMITHCPLLLMLALLCFLEDARSEEPEKTAFLNPQRLQLLILAVMNACASVAGLVVNKLLVKMGYTVSVEPDANKLSLLDTSGLHQLFHGFFHQFGFRDRVSLFSPAGILAMAGLALSIYVVVISVRRLLSRTTDQDIRKTILFLFFLCYTSTMVLVFFITGSAVHCYPLYLSLCLPWAVPLLLDNFFHRPKSFHFLHLKRLFAWLAVVLLFVNGAANLTWFHGSKLFDQPYEGLFAQVPDKKEAMSDFVDYATENGYDVGYSLHWEANLTTEMTNGQIPMVSVNCDNDNGNLVYCNCLTSLWLREMPVEKPFFLLDAYYRDSFENLSDSAQYCKLVFADDRHCFYDITNLEGFISLLYS